jgi:multidrug transporter EmrE-like cation transporter
VGVAVLGWVWFVEVLGPVEIVGVLAVVAGIVLAQTARRAHVQVEPPVLT